MEEIKDNQGLTERRNSLSHSSPQKKEYKTRILSYFSKPSKRAKNKRRVKHFDINAQSGGSENGTGESSDGASSEDEDGYGDVEEDEDEMIEDDDGETTTPTTQQQEQEPHKRRGRPPKKRPSDDSGTQDHRAKRAHHGSAVPAHQIKLISTNKKLRYEPFFENSLKTSIPENEEFRLPDDQDYLRPYDNLVESIPKSDVTDKLTEETIDILVGEYKRIFYTEPDYVYILSASQLLQLMYISKGSISLLVNGRNVAYLKCCFGNAYIPCPQVFGLYYDQNHNCFYIRPKKLREHIHDFKCLRLEDNPDEIVSHQPTFKQKKAPKSIAENETSTNQSSKKQKKSNHKHMDFTKSPQLTLDQMNKIAIPVDIPENSFFDFELQEDEQLIDTLSHVKSMKKPSSYIVHSSVRDAYMKMFFIKNQIYAFTPSQFGQLLDAVKRLFWITAPHDQNVYLICSLTKNGIPGGDICRSACSLFADIKNQLLYLRKTGNPERRQIHNHGLQSCLAKTGVLDTDVDEEAWFKQEEEYEASLKKADTAEQSETAVEEDDEDDDESMDDEDDEDDGAVKMEDDDDEDIRLLADPSHNFEAMIMIL
ncbi:unnamed protein product [Ambrosiozyma monospora]|uniref:Unnamed protein product n=1 Tax=Ambrosiozyma monospora TaxID=43982 RepID=A0A9W6Z2M6_AMBMO|nr:unnamed protein product [Ambrosiozyma monospora]